MKLCSFALFVSLFNVVVKMCNRWPIYIKLITFSTIGSNHRLHIVLILKVGYYSLFFSLFISTVSSLSDVDVADIFSI